MTCGSPFIDVILKDGSYCKMVPKALNMMLRHDRVQKFRRSDGWANVGVPPCGESGPTAITWARSAEAPAATTANRRS